MGFNLNLDMNKLPHFWQTVAAMMVGGILIGASGIFIATKISKGGEAINETKQAVESINTRLDGVESTQSEIIDSQASYASKVDDLGEDLSEQIDKVDGRLIYFINHQDDMTAEQILEAFDIGYSNGFSAGKKNEMTP